MLDFSAYLAAQQITRGAVSEGRPAAPVRPDRVPVARRAGVGAVRRFSWTLRRVADILPPAPQQVGSPLPAIRQAASH